MYLHYQIEGRGISALQMLILHDVGLQIRLSRGVVRITAT